MIALKSPSTWTVATHRLRMIMWIVLDVCPLLSIPMTSSNWWVIGPSTVVAFEIAALIYLTRPSMQQMRVKSNRLLSGVRIVHMGSQRNMWCLITWMSTPAFIWIDSPVPFENHHVSFWSSMNGYSRAFASLFPVPINHWLFTSNSRWLPYSDWFIWPLLPSIACRQLVKCLHANASCIIS